MSPYEGDPDLYWNMPPPIIRAPEGAQHGKSGVYYGGELMECIVFVLWELGDNYLTEVSSSPRYLQYYSLTLLYMNYGNPLKCRKLVGY